jgi:antitoxin-like ribbon-helix-helix protein
MKRTRPSLTGAFGNEPAELETKAATVSRPDRTGRVSMPFWTTATAKKQLRLLAAEEETTQQALLTEALNTLFRARGKPPVA